MGPADIYPWQPVRAASEARASEAQLEGGGRRKAPTLGPRRWARESNLPFSEAGEDPKVLALPTLLPQAISRLSISRHKGTIRCRARARVLGLP